ncbi:MAG TPA: VOC family protein [Anaerolineales bacterium]|nr:VOC family protein [Anaerolineales bacterium]
MAYIRTGAVNHQTLTVSDLKRSQDFYTGLLGFQKVMDLSPTRVLLSNGSTLIALTLAPDPSRAIQGDVFNENRLGLDHLSLSVAGLNDLEEAVGILDAADVSHGEIKDLRPDLPIYVLAFRDPDNIQLELTAPVS